MKAQAVEEHLFAEEVHFFNIHEQRGYAGANNRAEKDKTGGRERDHLHNQSFFVVPPKCPSEAPRC